MDHMLASTRGEQCESSEEYIWLKILILTVCDAQGGTRIFQGHTPDTGKVCTNGVLNTWANFFSLARLIDEGHWFIRLAEWHTSL